MKGVRFQLSLFILLGILLIPFSWNLVPFHADFVRFVFTSFATWVTGIFSISSGLSDFSSDSVWLYILVITFLIASVIFNLGLNVFKVKINEDQFNEWSRTIAVYFLSVVLLKYGFDKIFKAQFYLPEPNLLYTPLGKLDKDILFWSTMGSSYSYNLFMGFAEVIPGVLILFKRTRELGLVISFAVLINVFAINLSFDISVKLLVSFLLIVTSFLLIPTFRFLWEMFIMKKSMPKNPLLTNGLQFKDKGFIKGIAITVILIESLLPYLQSGIYNDDSAERPYLHGAYEVTQIRTGNSQLANCDFPYKRIFLHRDGYMIFQDQQDDMTDYKIEIDPGKSVIHLFSYDGKLEHLNYDYHAIDSTLTLKFGKGRVSTIVKAKELNWRKLPLLKPQFHWTVD